MNPDYPIQYLKRSGIDTDRWDNCLSTAANGLIYGKTFFLDAMTEGQWDALILGDYETVMPLTWRQKAGIRYLYQPAFAQQTGIFSISPLTTELTATFLARTRQHFRFAEIF